jgi:serine acetyltransferase
MNTDNRYPHVNIEPGAQISAGCNLGAGCQVSSQAWLAPNVVLGREVCLLGEVHLARDVILGRNCSLQGPLQIDEGVKLAPGVQVGTSTTVRTHIRLGTRIGAQANLLGGITVGQNAFIRSNSHVIGDVPDHALVSGAPALLEAYVCPHCVTRLSVVRNSPSRQVVYLKCRRCGHPEIGLPVSNYLPRLAHILLPGHLPGPLVDLAGNDYRWLDDREMMDLSAAGIRSSNS